MVNCEIAIVGSGIGASVYAVEMAKLNKDYLLIHDPSAVSHRPVWILQDYTEKYPETKIGRRETKTVRLMTGKSDFSVDHQPGKYWVIDPRAVIEGVKKRVDPAKSIEVSLQKNVPKIVRNNKGELLIVDTGGETIHTEKVINATGIDGQIEVGHQKKDYLVENLFGITLRGSLKDDEMILLFLPKGGTCWIANSVYEGYVDAVVTAWGPKSKSDDFFKTGAQRLSHLIQFVQRKENIKIRSYNPEEVYRGSISAHRFNHKLPSDIFPFGELLQGTRPASQESFNRILQTGNDLRKSIEANHTPSQFVKKVQQAHQTDDFMFSGLIGRIITFNENIQGGASIDAIHLMLKKSSPEKRKRLERQLEDWVQHGKVEKSFILELALSERELLKSLLISGATCLTSGLIGTERLFNAAKLMNDHVLKKGYFNN